MKRDSKEKKIAIVAGGAGFIGSHLCGRLLTEGYAVRVIDNLYTGSENNIRSYQEHPHFEFFRHDITTPYLCDDASVIFNLACPASPSKYQQDPIFTTRTSVLGTLNMLELARRNDCVMLQASTSEVYGNPNVHPQTENYHGCVNPIGPRSCYDEGKRCAESLCMDYFRQYGTKVKIFRIFNTYGPNMAVDDGRVMSKMIVQALSSQPLSIHGNGQQTRSFMYVDDLIEAIIRLASTADSVTGPINIGNPDERSIENLAKTIIAKTHSTSTTTHLPLPPDDPCRRCPDISLAKDTLNDWHPTIGIDEGLQRTIDYFKSLLAD